MEHNLHSSYNDIFTILKYSLLPDDNYPITVSDDIDLHFIYPEMQAQTVSTLAYPWLKSHTLPDSELQQKWMTACLQQQARWMQVMHAQTQLINLMEQHNIPCVIIKGAAAMMAYPNPSLRAVGDIDFLVRRSDYDKSATVLETNGYCLVSEKDPKFHHYEYEKNGITFELHKRIGIIEESDEQLLSRFEKGIDNREWNTIGNFSFPTLPVDLNGLVLLLHINQHLRVGIGLRHIVDWMMFIYKNNNYDSIIPIIRFTGMEKLANTVTVMCQKYLGLPIMINDSEDYPYEELFDYIITKGNLGKKAGTEGKITSFSIFAANPILFFQKLQRSGLRSWGAAKKHAVLRPFAWLYRICCFIKYLFSIKITPNKLIKTHTDGKAQLDLIYRLGLTEDNTIKSNRNSILE